MSIEIELEVLKLHRILLFIKTIKHFVSLSLTNRNAAFC